MPRFFSRGQPAATSSPTPAAATATVGTGEEGLPYHRAAALTYRIAPYPSDSIDGVLEALLALAADKRDPTGGKLGNTADTAQGAASATWLSRAWGHVVGSPMSHLLQARQSTFVEAFSRQLELHPAQESSTVMASCQCSIVSNGNLHPGLLFATNCALYFCSSTTESTPAAVSAATSPGATLSSSAPGRDGEAEEGTHYIKERVLFTDIASVLPSIALEQHGTTTPFIQGIPSGVVAPTALQVFTVQLSTVLQFVGLHNVAVKPARRSAADAARESGDAPPSAPCTDVVRRGEDGLVHALPPHLDTLKFSALVFRLWATRLRELGRPLEHPAAQYAQPH
ncbi:hypothetical protein NESM_000485600 [Novymonas esmeraldas]|uniref:GRAM domain-containing protein n=1 Tax=Novymonas esmeraldas TaxID=1808958 RepID=A0AAW0ENE2_9TRYP